MAFKPFLDLLKGILEMDPHLRITQVKFYNILQLFLSSLPNIVAAVCNYPWWSPSVYRKVMVRERNTDCALHALSFFHSLLLKKKIF